MVFARPAAATLVVGALIALVGLAIRAWASGHIRKASELAVSGPYAYTRNPLYVGSFVLGVGFTIAANVWWLAILFCILFLGIYVPVMRVEAEDMRRIFGSEYEEYEQKVSMFIPYGNVWKRTNREFDFQLYLRYREYRAALGAVLAIAALTVKAYFLGSL